MGTVLDAVREEVERTIHALDQKRFDPDPIAGPHFSKITSVMSSAYKRHGYILDIDASDEALAPLSFRLGQSLPERPTVF